MAWLIPVNALHPDWMPHAAAALQLLLANHLIVEGIRPAAFQRGIPVFDGTDFPDLPQRRRPVNETVVTILIVAFAMVMLLMPISLVSLVDLIRYIQAK